MYKNFMCFSYLFKLKKLTVACAIRYTKLSVFKFKDSYFLEIIFLCICQSLDILSFFSFVLTVSLAFILFTFLCYLYWHKNITILFPNSQENYYSNFKKHITILNKHEWIWMGRNCTLCKGSYFTNVIYPWIYCFIAHSTELSM